MQMFDLLAMLIGLAMVLGFLAGMVRHGTLVWLAKTMTDDQVATFVALRDARAGRSKHPACPCQDLHSLTVATPTQTLQTRISVEGIEAVRRAAGQAH